ncbi:beta-1,6-N-acetylglucosaminyltransferase [Blautia sp. HCP3S3_D9]|uniref:beta-1,6-N-acetylglucosaminyltransferase n=1 Tax=Blautia sp. HCP3S3_D9 TaxID=3438912 RepID=UPI003F88ED97
MESKHAYLIMAHNKFDMLITLIQQLDDTRNDIYIHIDKKAEDVPYSEIKNSIAKSKLYFVKSVNVIWGHYSQIECEMELLKAANANRKYQYLHLLSGVDLPIKSQEEIHNFFEENQGKEFLDIEVEENDRHTRARCRYYWLFQRINGRHSNKSIFRILEGINVRVQRTLKVCRIPKQIVIKKGANWFSITGDFAEYIVGKEKLIEKYFKKSFCGDEVFIQTLLYNSAYKDNIYIPKDQENTNRRLIDWNRGNPYIFRSEDLKLLQQSNCLFARKFDIEVDEKIIENLVKYINEKSN